jgi:prevent-host-death family protein
LDPRSYPVKIARKVKPISYLKTHTAEVLRSVNGGKSPLLITHHGEVKMVVQDITDFEATRESMAFLKILAMGEKSRDAGRSRPVGKAFAAVRRRIAGERG